jgi:hypothetical protein
MFSGHISAAAIANFFARGFLHDHCGVIDFLFDEASFQYFLTQMLAPESRWIHATTVVRMDAETSDGDRKTIVGCATARLCVCHAVFNAPRHCLRHQALQRRLLSLAHASAKCPGSANAADYERLSRKQDSDDGLIIH